MNVSLEEAIELFQHNPSGVPIDNVLKTRHQQWDTRSPTISVFKKKISIQQDGVEAIFVLPAAKVLEAHINEPNSGYHSIRVSKQMIPPWDGHSPSLPYTTCTADFFFKLERVVQDSLRSAFDDPDVFEEATSTAWQCVNMEADNPEELAFEIFVNNAKLPYSNTEWEIKRNAVRNKSQRVYVPIVDIANVEHTMKYTIDKDAIVSVAIRLWPYHFSENSYGVSASFADAGIKVWHKGGVTVPRRRWKPYHYHVVVSADRTGKHIYTVYDIRGNVFKIKTPVVTLQTVGANGFTIALPEKDPDWCAALETLRQHISSTIGVAVDSAVFVHATAHSLVPGDRVILTLSVLLEPKIQFHLIECFKV